MHRGLPPVSLSLCLALQALWLLELNWRSPHFQSALGPNAANVRLLIDYFGLDGRACAASSMRRAVAVTCFEAIDAHWPN